MGKVKSGNSASSDSPTFAIWNVHFIRTNPMHAEVVFDHPNDQKKHMIVLLCGWMGSQIKQTRRFANMLTEDGYYVARTVMPTRTVFGSDKNRYRFVHSLVQQVVTHFTTEFQHGTLPVVVYCFSNGGAEVYEQLVKDSHLRAPLAIHGLIMDSAPGDLTPQSAYGAFRAMPIPLMGRVLVYSLVAAIPASIFLLARKFISMWKPSLEAASLNRAATGVFLFFFALYYLTAYRRNRQYRNTLSQAKTYHPELYLYSTKDKLCTERSVRGMINARNSPSERFVSSYLFEKSPHVQHYLKEPELYARIIFDFLHNNVDKFVHH